MGLLTIGRYKRLPATSVVAVALSLTRGSSVEVAVSITVSVSPKVAVIGMTTVSVTAWLAPGANALVVAVDKVDVQTSPDNAKVKVSVESPVLVTVKT